MAFGRGTAVSDSGEHGALQNGLLVVCAMNRCRSPVVARVLADAAAQDHVHEWHIASAGTDAVEGQPLCRAAEEVMRARVQPLVESDEEGAHRARRLSLEDLAMADLVLVASTRERSAVARMSPGARAKCFTLKEAVLLAANPASPAEVRDCGRHSKSQLAAIAHLLNSRRGSLPKSGARRKADSRLNLPETHGQRRHRRDLRRAARAGEAMAAALNDLGRQFSDLPTHHGSAE